MNGLHCFLNGHSLSKPCPHHFGQTFKIANECGGLPFQKDSIVAGFDLTCLKQQDGSFFPYLFSGEIIYLSDIFASLSLIPPSPPPKKKFTLTFYTH